MLCILLSLIADSCLSFPLNTIGLLLTAPSIDVLPYAALSYPKIVGEIIDVIIKRVKNIYNLDTWLKAFLLTKAYPLTKSH